MKHRLCYISRCYHDLVLAGNKAKTDSEATLDSLGAVNLGLPQKVNGNKVGAFFYNLAGVVRYLFTVRRGDIVLLQYPVKKYFTLICRVAHHRGARVVALVHDLGSMRRRKLTVAQELRRLEHADGVIATNEVMEQWLIDQGLKVAFTDHMGLWDYLSPAQSPVATTEETPSSTSSAISPRPTIIAYAGNLKERKASWLRQWPEGGHPYVIHVFGHSELEGLTARQDLQVMGSAAPETFISRCGCDLGLVWDGHSIDTCTGNFGEYLRYNTPHKVSFYLRAGLPVVVWRQSAMAHIVEQEGIGITIDRLADLDRLLPLPPEELARLRSNVARVGQRIAQGDYLREVVGRAMQRLS